MNASVLKSVGEHTKLKYSSVSDPKKLPEMATVKVHYCGVNHLDLLILQGKRPGPKVFPHILGSEIVGEVCDIGTQESELSIGDMVSVYPWTFCGNCQQCKNSREQICDTGGTIGRT